MKSNINSPIQLKNNTTFELNNNGVFSSPNTVTNPVTSSSNNNSSLYNTANTYTYNTNTYNILTPPNPKTATSPLR